MRRTRYYVLISLVPSILYLGFTVIDPLFLPYRISNITCHIKYFYPVRIPGLDEGGGMHKEAGLDKAEGGTGRSVVKLVTLAESRTNLGLPT